MLRIKFSLFFWAAVNEIDRLSFDANTLGAFFVLLDNEGAVVVVVVV